jgi:H+-transporting ATPase
VLLFMTLAIVVFNFYPLTAVMIVMLALLNDGAILSIAYDNVHYRNAPEVWNMRPVLGVSTVLGVFGVISAFGLFYLGERVFHLDRAHIQTLMYLKLSVAGHLTIFLTRTRGPFWSIRPARILWIAVLGTQAIATFIAIFGLGLVTPLGWYWALLVWGYALAWFLVNDRAKLITYWLLDYARTEEKPDVNAKPKPEAKAESKPGTTVEYQPIPKAGSQPEAEGCPKPDAKAAPEPDAKGEPKPDAKTETKPETKPGPPPESQVEAKPDAKAQPKPETNAEPRLEAKVAPETEVKSAPTPETKADIETLLNTTLGDVLLAGVLKHPEDAGHIIAEAIVEAEAAIGAGKVSQAKPVPVPEAKATAPSASTSKAPT